MRYVAARARQDGYDRTYRSYMSDAARMITQNTAGTVDKGIYIPQRFVELFETDDDTPAEEDTRTCVEIVADMWKNIRGGKHDG